MKIFRLLLILTLMFFSVIVNAQKNIKYAVLISANMEWKAVKKFYPDEKIEKSVWGEFFYKRIANKEVLFYHEGWGKVAAAGATQYVIDNFKPEVLINLGTCGGFDGEINRLDVILVNKTIIYDIVEAMGDSKEAIEAYSTNIDLSWLGEEYPSKVIKTLLVSADKDLRVDEIEHLRKEYGAIAGDWETGAIAYTASKNKKKLVILRGVTDLVNKQKGEAYGNFELFVKKAEEVMFILLKKLPDWLALIESKTDTQE